MARERSPRGRVGMRALGSGILGRAILAAAALVALTRGGLADTSGYAVFGSNGVSIGSNGFVGGSVASNVDVSVYDNSLVLGSVASGGSAYLGTDAQVAGGVTVPDAAGFYASPGASPSAPTVASVAFMSPCEVTVPGYLEGGAITQLDDSPAPGLALAPGAYQMGANGFTSVTLSSGEYYIEGLYTEPGAAIALNASGGSITVYADSATLSEGTSMTLAGGSWDSVAFKCTSGWYSGSGCLLYGSISAPDGSVAISQDTLLSGTVCGDYVALGDNVSVYGGTGSPPGQPIPEPASMVLGFLGLVSFGGYLRKHRSRDASAAA